MLSVDNAHNNPGVEDGLQMPNVFVTPPEEDLVPTWCCFDAANPSQVIQHPEPKEISPIAFSPDDGYYTSMDYVIPPPTTTIISVVDDAITNQHRQVEDDLETISDYGHELEDEDISSSIRDIANDSDVIEVFKLPRYRTAAQADAPQQPVQTTKPPSSLKSRASRAFKSLAGSLRGKSKTQTIVSLSSTSSSQNAHSEAQSRQETVLPTSRSHTPTALRRGSVILSQLFTTPITTRSSISSFDEQSLTSPTSANFRFSESSSSAGDQLLPSSSYSYQVSLDQARLAASSPAPTISSRTSSRRFSMLSLQKLFSFGSAKPGTSEEDAEENIYQPEEPEMNSPATPVLRSVPSTPAFSSSSSNSGPETPTSAHHQIPIRLVTSNSSIDGAPDFPAFNTLESIFDSNQNLNLGLGLDLDLPTRISLGHTEPSTPRKSFSPTGGMWGSITPKGRKRSTPPSHEADISLEMRLDSLHFDSLTFDVDRFSFK